MVLAIHYCLVNHIQFVLESENANFSSGRGWTEFFQPFCKEKKNRLLNKYNHRIKPTYSNRIDWLLFNVFKRIHPRQLYMYSLFNKIRKVDNEVVYEIKELGIKGNLLENCSEIHRMIWRYNAATSSRIEDLIHGCSLPCSYIGMHIRQGDKWTESKMYSPDEYMQHALKYSKEKSVFVLTDDYRVIEALRSHYADHDFYTLCRESETGYDFQKFKRMPVEVQTESFLRLWASMDIMERAGMFIGTYSANPGMNMGFRMCMEQIRCLDYQEWQLW